MRFGQPLQCLVESSLEMRIIIEFSQLHLQPRRPLPVHRVASLFAHSRLVRTSIPPYTQAKPALETSEPAEISPQMAPGSFTIRAEQARAEISPEVTLELRIGWLEALLWGVRQEATRERRVSM
jgi:hypothetical protein